MALQKISHVGTDRGLPVVLQGGETLAPRKNYVRSGDRISSADAKDRTRACSGDTDVCLLALTSKILPVTFGLYREVFLFGMVIH